MCSCNYCLFVSGSYFFRSRFAFARYICEMKGILLHLCMFIKLYLRMKLKFWDVFLKVVIAAVGALAGAVGVSL